MESLVPAYEGRKPYIFVSYAHKDSFVVLPIIEELYNRKYRVWYDEGIAPGSEWPKNIADHLNSAKAVIICKSQNSLASPNCANEVKMANDSGDKLVITIEVGDTQKINIEQLLEKIPDEYIGDGSGYERKVGKEKYGALWNILIVLAVIIAITIGVGLYGMNKGWFDQYLPGLHTNETGNIEVDTTEDIKELGIAFNDDALASTIASQIDGKANLADKLSFNSDEDRFEFCSSIGYQGNPEEITYMDLTTFGMEEVRFDRCNDTYLEYLTYLPNLQKVYIRFHNFPLLIPSDAQYKVIVWGDRK